MSEQSIRHDLELHLELSPLLELNSCGEVECFGWGSPIYEFDEQVLKEEEEPQQ